ncbi:hypothetical protein MCOR04_010777 [Pyricularia oryzae]|nr:hypothetical protein MCOR04_010777 [Pyricularia oryzae]
MDAEFRRVHDTFKANLTAGELDYFRGSGLENVQIALQRIQKEQEGKRQLLYLNRIDPYLKTMIEYGKVVEVFLNVSEILAFVWGPLKFLLMITSNFSDAFNSLLDTYQEIGEQIPLLESFKTLFQDSVNTHMRQLLVLIYEDILRFQLLALRYFRKKMWKQLFVASWGGFKSEIKLLKDNLGRHRRLIESRASLTQFEEVLNIRANAEKYFKELKDGENRRRREVVFRWLSSADVEAVHEQRVDARAWSSQSCSWLLQAQLFQHWFDPMYCQTPLLWLNGKPGSGKSVLASLIIEEARKLPDISVAFFYCNESDPATRDFVAIARSILAQLLAQDDSLLLHLEHRMSTPTGKAPQAVLSDMKLAKELLTVALRSRKTYIILDGIDECDRNQRKEICRWYREVVEGLPRLKYDEIRCLFISQDDGVGRKDLSSLSTLRLTPESNLEDIKAFSRHWQGQIERRFDSVKKHNLDFTEIVTARSQGMFIFARCVFEELYNQPSGQAVLDEWREDRFPKDLEDLYERILLRIIGTGTANQQDASKKLLSWIAVARRPLRWYEIQASYSINLDDETINTEEGRLRGTAKDHCASFVDVRADQTVSFVHGTVRTFLMSHSAFDPARIELDLCLCSMAYLNFPGMDPHRDDQELSNSLLAGGYAFYEYAVASWVWHLTAWLQGGNYGEDDMTDLEEVATSFLDQHHRQNAPKFPISTGMHMLLKPIAHFQSFESLAQAIVWSRKQFTISEANNDHNNSVLDFPDITSNIRRVLERIRAQASMEKLELYYGKNLFKCSKLYCPHFYDGFASQAQRDAHHDRHNQTFVCSEAGCHRQTFAFVSNRELELHMMEEHGKSMIDFPDVSDPNEEQARVNDRRKHFAIFQCSICPRRFTRKYNLRSHLRTHTNDRPFVCTACGKAFSRQNDRNVHERIHLRVK